jgi:hypothetical protein
MTTTRTRTTSALGAAWLALLLAACNTAPSDETEQLNQELQANVSGKLDKVLGPGAPTEQAVFDAYVHSVCACADEACLVAIGKQYVPLLAKARPSPGYSWTKAFREAKKCRQRIVPIPPELQRGAQ